MRTLLDDKLRELALFEPTHFPVLSLFLDTQADQHGRAKVEPFVRRELERGAEAFQSRTPERRSYDHDAARIEEWIRNELEPSSNAAVLYACSGAGEFFEAFQFETPIAERELHARPRPWLYPLARLNSGYPAYAAVVADTNSARIFVVGLARTLNSESIQNPKVRSRTNFGGWSQARYQRHAENFHLHHSKETMSELEKIVREQGLDAVILAGDEVILPELRAQLPPFLEDKIVEQIKLDIRTPEHEAVAATLEVMQRHNLRTLAGEAGAAWDDAQAGGLGAAGLGDVLEALSSGQAHRLYLSPAMETPALDETLYARLEPVLCRMPGVRPNGADLADALVTLAYRSSADVRFVEDQAALEPAGGVAARLRYRAHSGGTQ